MGNQEYVYPKQPSRINSNVIPMSAPTLRTKWPSKGCLWSMYLVGFTRGYTVYGPNCRVHLVSWAILYYIMLYYTRFDYILYYTILYYTILYYTILYYTILYYTILYYTILYYTILYYTILYYTILYDTIRYDTILYYTILYYTILYYTIPYYKLRAAPRTTLGWNCVRPSACSTGPPEKRSRQ